MIPGMLAAAEIGFATSLFESTATSVGYGVVIGGFAAAVLGILVGRSRTEMEADAPRVTFYGGSLGMFCLCFDFLMKYGGLQGTRGTEVGGHSAQAHGLSRNGGYWSVTRVKA
jgi:hypothetical protein